METRTVEEVKVYKLILNSVYDCCECGDLVAASYDLNKLTGWYFEQRCPQYSSDDNYRRNFKEGSKLYRYNPCDYEVQAGTHDHWGHGISEEWVILNEMDDIIRRNSWTWVY